MKAKASLGESECQDCEHCQTEELANSKKEIALVSGAGPSSKPAAKSLLSTLAPWITPLGGIVLVSAHLLNRRCGYLCDCCGPTEATAE